jgi:hypothetical protein
MMMATWCVSCFDIFAKLCGIEKYTAKSVDCAQRAATIITPLNPLVIIFIIQVSFYVMVRK